MDVTDAPYPDETSCSFYQSNAGQSCSWDPEDVSVGVVSARQMLYRPVRERNVERLKQYAHDILQNTGHEEISLSSLSSSDYSELKELVTYLIDMSLRIRELIFLFRLFESMPSLLM